jgi:hypothetical protein
MPLIKVYNNDSDPYGLKGHSIFKSVRPFSFGYAVVPKLCKRCLRHHVRAASAKAVSFRRTFGDEAWSQQGRPPSLRGTNQWDEWTTPRGGIHRRWSVCEEQLPP